MKISVIVPGGACAATLLLGLVLASGSLAAQQAPGLIAKNPIRLTNVEGRMDHLGVDLKGQRFLVTAFDNQTLEVLVKASSCNVLILQWRRERDSNPR